MSRSPQRSPQLPPLPSNVSQTVIMLWIVFMFILGYWGFARFFEQIDLSNTIPFWFQGEALPALFHFARELFHWRVLRHFVPVVAGWWLAYQATLGIVRVLYDLPDGATARRFLSQLIYAGSASSAAPVTLTNELLRERRDQFVVLRIGGPGWVKIRNGYVAVTEYNGQIYRILGTGRHYLGPFEYVHDVLDLRVQERIAENVLLTSKDGIPVTATLTIQFRIATSDEPPTRLDPYPFDEAAVKIAAYSQKLRPDGTLSRWDDAPLALAEDHLIRIFSKHMVDTILVPPGSENQTLSSVPLVSIRNELTTRLRENLQQRGIELVDVQISQIVLPDDVTQQYIKYWQSDSDTRIRLSLADGEARALEEMELADAEAEMTMIRAILEGVHRARQSGNGANMRDVVALRLIEALEKMARQSQQVVQLPNSQQIIAQIDSFRTQLSDANALAETAVSTEAEAENDDGEDTLW